VGALCDYHHVGGIQGEARIRGPHGFSRRLQRGISGEVHLGTPFQRGEPSTSSPAEKGEKPQHSLGWGKKSQRERGTPGPTILHQGEGSPFVVEKIPHTIYIDKRKPKDVTFLWGEKKTFNQRGERRSITEPKQVSE